ncbi:MAG: pyridoxal 5'-phosphate synthase glutaminase subunit PdxT [Ruminococcus sp.]|nr:pyridoxal 5'-phosphate synthase glutaminase subunit PdxT [Ruminococcus sp.]
MRIAVLALQGAFAEHEKALERLGAESVEIRQKSDFTGGFDGIIIPGGESTVMGKLLKELDLFDTLLKQIKSGTPCYGTCAGLILLAEEISNDDKKYFGALPVRVKRNAYGRQLGSFSKYGDFNGKEIPQVFIRAPYIEKILHKDCEVLSEHDGFVTGVKYKNLIATSFHPELTDDLTVHKYFIEMIKKRNKK